MTTPGARARPGAAASTCWWGRRGSALLAPVVAGAVVGGLIGKFSKHRVETGVESGLGEKLKPGTAAILVSVREDDRLAAN